MMRSLFLALAASALGLHAGLTLSAPATTSAGKTLMMKATGHGAETKERWSWAFWLDGRPLKVPAEPLHLDASTCTVCLVVPPDASNQVLKVEVRRGGEVASDTLLVVPVTKDMGETKHPLKKARTQAPEETKEPSVPDLGKLPKDLSRLLTSFVPDPLRYVNKAMNEFARQAELRFAPLEDFTDDELLRYVQRHRNLRELELDLDNAGSACSEAGVLKALKAMPKLERLKIASGCELFEPEAFTEVLRTLPRLTHLSVNFPVTEALLAACGKLTHLDLPECFVPPAGFRSLHHLKELTVRECPLIFEHTLPPGLEVLTVEDCRSFTGKGLPTTLRVLSVKDCDAFEGVGLPALGELRVVRCPLFSGRDLGPGLHTLVLEQVDDFTGAGLPVTLEHLGVVECPAFSGDGLPAGLKTLSVLRVGGFTGETLPPGLESLKVHTVANFLGKRLPERLRALEVTWANQFNPGRLPETLASLAVAHCPAFTGAGLLEGLRTLDVGMDNTGEFDQLFPGIGSLSLRCYDPAKVEPIAGMLAQAGDLKRLGLSSFDASILRRFRGAGDRAGAEVSLAHPAEEEYPDAAPFPPGTRAWAEGPSAPGPTPGSSASVSNRR